jgi:hypothetical protein
LIKCFLSGDFRRKYWRDGCQRTASGICCFVASIMVIKGYIKFNYVVCLSDTCSSCHVTVMGSLIVLVNKSWLKCACFLNLISREASDTGEFTWCFLSGDFRRKYWRDGCQRTATQIWKWSFSNILLFYLDVVWFGRWQEPWNFKTSHFRIYVSYMTGRADVWEADDIVQFYIALLDFFPATL